MHDAVHAAGSYRFESFRRDVATAPDDLARLLEIWRELAGAGRLPHPRQATFDAFVFMIGRVHLVDVRADGRLYYRLYGTGSGYPLDVHKRSTASIRPAGFRALVEQHYRECVAERVPIYREIVVTGPRRTGRMFRLLLPYACDGATPDLIVNGFVEDRDMAETFRESEFRALTEDLVLEDPD